MTHLPLILVTGSNGQVGSELREQAALDPAWRYLFLTRTEAPLHDREALAAAVQTHRPWAVVNCAAYTAVDKAESDREEAFRINADAVETLASACAATGARFIHLSTDYVFDGSRRQSLREDDPVSPLNVYGESKLAGEQAAIAANPDSLIIRTSWVYSVYGKNFVKTMLRLMAEKESISVVNDQWGSPTYAADLAGAIRSILAAPQWQPGIYHYSNEGIITWFDFATEIARQVKTSCRVLPTVTADFPTPARRPLYSVMDKKKMGETYSLHPLDWRESLRHCLTRLQQQREV